MALQAHRQDTQPPTCPEAVREQDHQAVLARDETVDATRREAAKVNPWYSFALGTLPLLIGTTGLIGWPRATLEAVVRP